MKKQCEKYGLPYHETARGKEKLKAEVENAIFDCQTRF